MATKRGSTKKSATKKSSKKTAKKSAKKSSAKGAAAPFPVVDFACIEACVNGYTRCVESGVDRKKCLKRLQRCILLCGQ